MPTNTLRLRKVWKFTFAIFEISLRVSTAAAFAWMFLAKMDYFYSFWLSRSGMMELVTRRARINLNFPDYACTTFGERVDSFLQMKHAVHVSPETIDSLYFQSSCSVGQVTYLTLSESRHLHEVSKLIDSLESFCLILILTWLAVVLLKVAMRAPIAKYSSNLKYMICLGAVGFVLIKVFGVEPIYKYMHVLLFPAGDKWAYSFYDSIMVTIFAAPRFFIFVTILLLCFTFLLTFLLTFIERFYEGRQHKS